MGWSRTLHVLSFAVALFCLQATNGATRAESMATETGTCDAVGGCTPAGVLVTRRRLWNPPEPVGPEASAETKAEVAVANTAKLHVVVRGRKQQISDAWDAFVDSLNVQALNYIVVDSNAALGSQQMRQLADELAASPSDVVFFIAEPEETILLAEATELTRKFNSHDAGILFPASFGCRARCALDWPRVPAGHGRFMVPSAFMAKADKFKLLVDSIPMLSTTSMITEADQLIALYMSDRDLYGMKLDTEFKVFQALYGYPDEWPAGVFSIEYEFHSEEDTRLLNVVTQQHPGVLLAHGNTKLLTQLNNYLPLRWHPDSQCLTCKTADTADPNARVTVAFNVLPESPFLQLVLDGLVKQELLKTHPVSLVVTVTNSPQAEFYLAILRNFTAAHGHEFSRVIVVEEVQPNAEVARKTLFGLVSQDSEATHVLYHTSAGRLMNSTVLNELVAQNLRVVSPMLVREGSYFANFWGAATGDRDAVCLDDEQRCQTWATVGECEKNEQYMKTHCQKSCGVCFPAGPLRKVQYKRSSDYRSIVDRQQTGVWAVPFINEVILLQKSAFDLILDAVQTADSTVDDVLEYDFPLTLYLLDKLRAAKLKLHVDNRHFYGLLINADNFNANAVHPDLFLVMDNTQHWKDLYLHEDYDPYAKLEFVQGRCWDIYNFPLFSEAFCHHFIELSESFSLWSAGSYSDNRLKTGYEPVPTRDIHFTQMGFQEAWTFILKNFVAPVAETQWVGYKLDGKHTLDFIVKYEPEGQPFLRKHHDASTFSLNVALNRIGIDFEGGGTSFTRQNCTVLTNQVGHALIHPGRLTHQHEGLYVTKGTRYIIVSFVDQV
eukprot:m.119411 g.119411  ORF g.119411 m.119411 type:complete len:834 (+) comp15470_c0_seq2:55-2556(+)